MVERLVVVGGDAAGMSAAAQARRRRGPDDLAIVAFERGDHTSYSACGIPYWVGDVVDGPDALVSRTPEEFAKAGIDARPRHEVTAIDTARRSVRVRDLAAGRTFDEPYDRLVVATGSVPVRPPIPGIDADGVYGVQVLGDGDAVRGELASGRVRSVVVVGSGYVGLEMAEAAKLRGLDVTIVDRLEQPMSTLDPDMGALVADAVRDMDIELVLGDGAAEIETDAAGRVRAVRTEGGRRFAADLVVLGLGVRPNVALAEEAGIPLGASGGIAVDRRMRTGVDGVWAAGDCAESAHRLTGRGVVVALGTHANKQGRVAGITIGGGYASFPGVIGTAATKVCDLEIARTGLSEREAAAAGYEVVAATVESTSRAGYYPGAQVMTVKLLAERRTGRLLGGQIVGREAAAKRIDVLATAVWTGLTVEEMVGLDLSYAPPFSPVWDAVLIAARKAADAVDADR